MNGVNPEEILDTLTTAVLRVDGSDRIVFINAAAAHLLAVGQRQARGRSLSEILPADDDLSRYVGRARQGGEPLALPELDLLSGPPPGHRRRVACDIVPLESNGDVQLELQPIDSRQRIAEETGLWRNHQAQRLLFQALAHEVKNPLSGLRGAAQLLAADIADPAQREYLDVMLRETDRLRDLVDKLLGPARPPRLATINIHAVLEHVRQVLEPASSLRWQRDYDPSLPELRADPDMLAQVFLNLAGNALQAVSAAGHPRLLLRTRVERNYASGGARHRTAVRIDVEDNGPGVPEHLRASLFLPLVTSRAEGSGLGLPIAQDIVQRHGGLIKWRSEPGETVFSVILPLHAEAAAYRGSEHERTS